MKILKGVYNTIMHKYEDITVSDEVYNCYRRAGWNIDDNDKAFYAHEIQMSSLIGGDDDAYENFREVISEETNPLNLLVHKATLSALRKRYRLLSNAEKRLINIVILQGKSEREYSAQTGIPQKTINDRKKRILSKLKNLLKI